jgi:hypothetical protein
MEDKDFIPYQEALELEKLGFDEYCMECCYYEWKDRGVTHILLHTPDSYDSHEGVKAPTYSQAFRWFRDNGKVAEIFSQLLPSNKYKWGFKIQGVEGVTDGFFTYEEAELACLKKLIEIAKALNI